MANDFGWQLWSISFSIQLLFSSLNLNDVFSLTEGGLAGSIVVLSLFSSSSHKSFCLWVKMIYSLATPLFLSTLARNIPVFQGYLMPVFFVTTSHDFHRLHAELLICHKIINSANSLWNLIDAFWYKEVKWSEEALKEFPLKVFSKQIQLDEWKLVCGVYVTKKKQQWNVFFQGPTVVDNYIFFGTTLAVKNASSEGTWCLWIICSFHNIA